MSHKKQSLLRLQKLFFFYFLAHVVSNITGKWVNELSWNFQEMSEMTKKCLDLLTLPELGTEECVSNITKKW